MQVSEKFILELVVLVTATVLIALGKLDPSVFIAILGIIFGERIYVAIRRRATASCGAVA